MDCDEFFLLAVAIVAAIFSLRIWIRRFLNLSKFPSRKSFSTCLAVVLFGCVLSVLLSLHLWADHEVKNSGSYLSLLTALGFGWITIFTARPVWPGFSLDEDVVERRNPAAVAASCGAIIGITFVYAGGSIGEGPSLFNNVFSFGIGSIAFLIAWTAAEFTMRISRLVAEERDLGAGIRLAGLLMAIGLVIGRSVAGTWESTNATTRDMLVDGWPCLLLVGLAAGVEPMFRPRRIVLFPSVTCSGVVPATAFVCLAVAYVVSLGKWK